MKEDNSINSLTVSLDEKQGEDTYFSNQLKTIFLYLKEHTATASMVTEATGIPQKNICRYKRDLEQRGLLMEVEKKLCKATTFPAWYLTTNTELIQLLNPKNDK